MLLMDHLLFSFVNSPWSDKGHHRIVRDDSTDFFEHAVLGDNIKQPAHPLIQDDRASVLTNIIWRQSKIYPPW